MSSVQNYSIYRPQRQISSVSTCNAWAMRPLKVSKTPASEQTPLPAKKKLEFNSKKRQRPLSPMKNSKRSKMNGKTIWNFMICLYDEDFKLSVNFRCFAENEIIPTEVQAVSVVSNPNDDDCKTQEKEVNVCSEYLAFQLEQSIIKEPCQS